MGKINLMSSWQHRISCPAVQLITAIAVFGKKKHIPKVFILGTCYTHARIDAVVHVLEAMYLGGRHCSHYTRMLW
jgi:hypothetical protein